jgi:uncharacterized repeat protein (TIGR03803 family)
MLTFAALLASASDAAPTLVFQVNFDRINGMWPRAALVADASGNLYGTTGNGGANDNGTVFKIAAGTHALSTLVSLGSLIADSSGNLYGTTFVGGSSNDGTVFKITKGTNALSTLATFTGTNGEHPSAGLIVDASGNLYGTTFQGGTNNYGTVFKVAAGTSTLSTLTNFVAGGGAGPEGSLIEDASGNLYGTTANGSLGYGSVFKIAAGTNALSTLVAFNSTDGANPAANLIADASGNLYGTTLAGGSSNDGTVFKITAGSNTLSTLASFDNTDGEGPIDGLIADAAGNLFGTTEYGGASNVGTVFRITAGTDTLSTLYTFNGGDGSDPYAALIADASGNLYGTTFQGGSGNDGTVFELTNTGFAVPEPASLSLIAIGSLTLLRQRRKVMRQTPVATTEITFG